MSTTLSVIVYRNPLEQAVWEGTASPAIIPILAGIIVFFACIYLTEKVINYSKFPLFSSKGEYLANAMVGLSVLAGAGTMWWMW